MSALTGKGQATRARIVSTAAQLMADHGAAATSVDTVRRAAQVSGSQITHYFHDKKSLIRAVIAWHSDTVTAPRSLDSFATLEAWAAEAVAEQRAHDCRGGCPLGSLAAELAEVDQDARTDLAVCFARWEALLCDGLRAMRDRGDLRPDADPDELALALLCALQGGMLLSQTQRAIDPLAAALTAVLAHIRTFEAH
jgi:AcrR family transcriptional regulator